MRIYFPLIFLFLSIVIFWCPQKTRAINPNIVINEIYAQPASSEVEWIELFNKSEENIVLTNYVIVDGTTNEKELDSYSINAKSYLLLEKGVDFSFTLNDSGDTVVLKKLGAAVDKISYGSWDDGDKADNAPCPKATGSSIARTPNGIDTDIDIDDFIIQKELTPGEENPAPPPNNPPEIPQLTYPLNGDVLNKNQQINFSWEKSIDPDGDEITYSLFIGCFENLDTADLIESVLSENEYLYLPENKCSKYFWQISAYDGKLSTKSEVFNFELVEPVYSKKIVVNEIMYDPVGEDTNNEWIELYNASSVPVDLSGWVLQDIKGSIKKYTISNLTISAKGYVILYRKQTKIVLNNDEDGIRLIQPDGNILYETNLYQNGDEGWSWARTSKGKWAWTTKATAKKTNIIIAPMPEDVGGDDETELIINSAPIEINTAGISQYDNYLIRLNGIVTSTSGSTFYLDDGSGKAKIYIQEKTNIEKPEMHKGDTFEIVGVVNLYRGVWRVLPRIQEDIKLIHCVKDVVLIETTKAKNTPIKKSDSETNSKPVLSSNPLIKEVKAVSTSDFSETSTQNNLFVQIIKMFTGLMMVFLVLLILKVRKYPKPIVIGGHFGQDDT